MGDAYDAMEATDVKAYERREMERRIDERASRLHSPILQHFETCVTLVDEDEAEHQALFEQNVALRLKIIECEKDYEATRDERDALQVTIDEALNEAREGLRRCRNQSRSRNERIDLTITSLRRLIIILSDEP
jgi:hypothetical protein